MSGEDRSAAVQDLTDDLAFARVESGAVMLASRSDAVQVVAVEEFLVALGGDRAAVIQCRVDATGDVSEQVPGIQQLRTDVVRYRKIQEFFQPVKVLWVELVILQVQAMVASYRGELCGGSDGDNSAVVYENTVGVFIGLL
jgi:hypothetical protein